MTVRVHPQWRGELSESYPRGVFVFTTAFLRRNTGRTRWLALPAAIVLVGAVAVPAVAAPVTTGNPVVSIGNGQAREFTPDGAVVQTLDGGSGSNETTGSVFDGAGNFYLTNFQDNSISKFDPNGNLVGLFGSGYSSPESILVDQSGNFYVGQAGLGQIKKLDGAGNELDSYTVETELRGADWIDLAADQKTIYYTSEGRTVKRFDVSTETQLADFATGLPGGSFALRILPDGGVLVASSSEVVRLDSSGTIIQSYTAPGDSGLFALNLAPDGTSFYTANINALGGGDNVYRFDIASGALLNQFDADPNTTVAGLSVKGERTAGGPPPVIPEAPSAALLFIVGLTSAVVLLTWLARTGGNTAKA